jgi:hypothetical protein
MNGFAIESLREALAAEDNDSYSDELMRRACGHWSKGLSSLAKQQFDLIVFVDPDYAQEPQKWEIAFTDTHTRQIRDEAYEAWEKAQFPDTVEDDRSGNVLRAYRKQTDTLRKYAIELTSSVICKTNKD